MPIKREEIKIDRNIQEINNILDVDIDNIKNNKIFLVSGSKVFKIEATGETTKNIEEAVKSEIKQEFIKNMKNIKKVVSKKFSEVTESNNHLKSLLSEKIKLYENKTRNIREMPEIPWDIARKGISVIKSSYNEIVYLVRGVYWPKTIDNKPIRIDILKKMITPINFYISVSKTGKVSEISTRKLINLDYFDHYHQEKPDCWGTWNPCDTTCKDPESVLNLAKKAESILENINTKSVADSEPNGLPNLDNLKRYVVDSKEKQDIKPTVRARRMGIKRTDEIRSQSIWEV